MQVSQHTALQSTSSQASQRSASRIRRGPPAVRLVPFALRTAFPFSLVGRDSDDYYGTSVAVGLAPAFPQQ